MKKFKVGQNLYFEKDGIHTVTITKVGKKYLTIDNTSLKVDIEKLREIKGWGCPRQFFLTAQEILDDRERDILYDKIKGYFKSHISLNKLKEIEAILSKEEVSRNVHFIKEGVIKIVESVSGYYHYHLSETGENMKPSLCGNSKVMKTSLPLSAWGSIGHLRESYCIACEEKAKGKGIIK